MNPVEFHLWLKQHLQRHALSRLPDPGTEAGEEFYGHWQAVFSQLGIDLDTATTASRRLADDPPRANRDHWPVLKRHCVEIRQAKGGSSGDPSTGTREEAEAAARGCEHCNGFGLLPVYGYHPTLRRTYSTTATCICAIGRWFRGRWIKQSPDHCRQAVDLADVLAGRSPYSMSPPSDPSPTTETPRIQDRPRPRELPTTGQIQADPILRSEYEPNRENTR